jgi:hypothetical protein
MQSGSLTRKLGLIIGINRYQDSTFHPLNFAENDAKALAQCLVNTKGGKWNPQDVQLVQGLHATKELTEALITQLCMRVATENNVVLLYFAGQAFVDERTGDGYLALANTRYQDTSTAMNVRNLIQMIYSQSHANQVLCIFDTFQVGPLWKMRRTSPYDSKPLIGTATLSLLQQSSNRLVLCSCRGNEGAAESGAGALGMFTHELLLGLCGQAAESRSGNVTLPKLHAYLFHSLPEQHRPQLFGQATAPIVLVGDAPPAPLQLSPAEGGAPVPGGLFQTSGIRKLPGSQTSGLFKMHAPLQMVPSSAEEPVQSARVMAPVAPAQFSPLEHDSGLVQQQVQCKELVAQAQFYLKNQNYKEAYDLAEMVLRIYPNEVAALTLKGQLLGTAGRFAEGSAVVEQILQLEPHNALAWSMQAVLLSNIAQQEAALAAINRSIGLDPNNTESLGIKARIMESIAAERARKSAGVVVTPHHNVNKTVLRKEGTGEVGFKVSTGAFFVDAGLQCLGFVVGGIGAGSSYLFQQGIPYLSLGLVAVGLAMMCVIATRGTFRYGFTRLVPTLLLSIISAAILGGMYQILGLTRILDNVGAQVEISPQAAITRLISFSFIGSWFAVAAILPLVSCILGSIVSKTLHAVQKNK